MADRPWKVTVNGSPEGTFASLEAAEGRALDRTVAAGHGAFTTVEHRKDGPHMVLAHDRKVREVLVSHGGREVATQAPMVLPAPRRHGAEVTAARLDDDLARYADVLSVNEAEAMELAARVLHQIAAGERAEEVRTDG